MSKLPLGIFLKCIACEASPSTTHFPLCGECAGALVPCPRLCPVCAQPSCPPEGCLRPWRRTETAQSPIQTYTAAYLLVSPCYTVIKKWKKRGGVLFDRRILKPREETKSNLRALGIQKVVPIPQHLKRSWRLGRSPAEKIAHWIAREIDVPVESMLSPAERTPFRQAELSAEARLGNALVFKPLNTARIQPRTSILLVDDFMTTGHTLRSAAFALRCAGADRVHAFCLGVRIQAGQEPELMPHLMERA